MTKGLARIARGLAPAVLVLTLGSLPCTTRAESPLPVLLEEVASGQSLELAAGAAALHVVFFAPWCPPCLSELKQLTEMEEGWSERGYRLVLIAVRNRNTRERLLRFSEQHRSPGTIYFDASGTAQRRFAAKELPTHFLFDAGGREVGRWPGLEDDLEDAVRKLLLSPSDG